MLLNFIGFFGIVVSLLFLATNLADNDIEISNCSMLLTDESILIQFEPFSNQG